MKKLALFSLLLFAGSCFGQLVLSIAPNGAVNAPIDTNGWQHFKVTLTQNITFSFVLVPPIPAPAQSTLRVMFIQDATGGRQVTFAANINSPCAISAIANATTVCSFTFDNATTTWQAATAGSIPTLVVKADVTAQAANVGFVNIYTVPPSGAGTYRFSAYLVITQAATTSSTLPMPSVSWTDNDSGVVTNAQFGLSPTANAVGINNSQGQSTTSVVFNVKTGTQIGYQTTGYASSGATPMQYAVHVKLEYLGP